MQTTRQHILDYLDTERSASARELARAFGMTAANLRHHLKELQARGLVTVVAERPAGGRGRPELLFGLSGAARTENTRGLASALLHILAAPELPKRLSTRLKRLAEQLRGGREPASGHITSRLVAAARRLEQLGYQPRWEARPAGPQLVLGHCPYAAIIDEHPELCQMDAHLLEGLTGAQAEQKSKLESGPEGLPQCLFSFNQ
jgi:predicted ArsR family transcriptional regulator